MAPSPQALPASPRSSTPRPSIMKRHSSQGVPRLGKSPGTDDGHRHIKKPHARVVLPRNHSSGRNLAKLARQAEQQHTRQRSHEGDTEIRLPGSLDESEGRPAVIRRNLTSSNLPRNASHTKLKKNYSHGQLQRLAPTKKAPPSPGLRGKSKRPKSLDWSIDEPKKVGFKVGDDEVPNMEGSGLDEGDWTEESASVSPYSTRANTANNSRRASIHERPERTSLSQVEHARKTPVDSDTDADGTPAASPPHDVVAETMQQQQPPPAPQIMRSPLHAAKEHPNPSAQFLDRHNGQLPAPAIVSNVEVSSLKASPAGSVTSNAVNPEDELVSRFIPTSTSNGSGTTTNMNTPKGSYKERYGPISPGSTVSGSSGAATPAHGRSRIELKMLQEKALADMESAAERGPTIPAHVYDRRNESLKSHLHLSALTYTSLGPEVFQGRFKAVNTELRVVQKFRNPIAESVIRLRSVKGSKLNLQAQQLRTSKSAVTLPNRRKEPVEKPILTSAKSSMIIKPRRAVPRGVSFAGMPEPEDRDPIEATIDEMAKEIWDSILS